MCIQDEVNGFKNSVCKVNEWRDCYGQTIQSECENFDKRDCLWIPNAPSIANGSSQGKFTGACVPSFTPGFDFWNPETEATELCALASQDCVVKFEKGIFGEPKCVENCDCLDEQWKGDMNNFCMALGDCGDKENYLGVKGRVIEEENTGNAIFGFVTKFFWGER